eukprot:g9693.t1
MSLPEDVREPLEEALGASRDKATDMILADYDGMRDIHLAATTKQKQRKTTTPNCIPHSVRNKPFPASAAPRDDLIVLDFILLLQLFLNKSSSAPGEQRQFCQPLTLWLRCKFALLLLVTTAAGGAFCSRPSSGEVKPSSSTAEAQSKGTRLRCAVRDVLSGIRHQKVQLLKAASKPSPSTPGGHATRGGPSDREGDQHDKTETKQEPCAICGEATSGRLVPCGHWVCAGCANDTSSHATENSSNKAPPCPCCRASFVAPSRLQNLHGLKKTTHALKSLLRSTRRALDVTGVREAPASVKRLAEKNIPDTEKALQWQENRMRKTELELLLAPGKLMMPIKGDRHRTPDADAEYAPGDEDNKKDDDEELNPGIFRETLMRELFGGVEGEDAGAELQLELKQLENRMRALRSCGSSSRGFSSSSASAAGEGQGQGETRDDTERSSWETRALAAIEAVAAERRKNRKSQIHQSTPEWLHLREGDQSTSEDEDEPPLSKRKTILGRTRHAVLRQVKKATGSPAFLAEAATTCLAVNRLAKGLLGLPNTLARFLIRVVFLRAVVRAGLRLSAVGYWFASREFRAAVQDFGKRTKEERTRTSRFYQRVVKSAPGVDRVCPGGEVGNSLRLLHELIYSDSGFERKDAAVRHAIG